MQDVYHRTHPILFSNRAVYAVVYAPRADTAASLDGYLQTIHAHAPDAPVIIVRTHADVPCADRLPFVSLKAQYPQVRLQSSRHGRVAPSNGVLICLGAA